MNKESLKKGQELSKKIEHFNYLINKVEADLEFNLYGCDYGKVYWTEIEDDFLVIAKAKISEHLKARMVEMQKEFKEL